MNKERRKELNRAHQMVSEANSIVKSVCDDEQDAFDNMPEGLQQGERGEKMEENVQLLDEAVDTLENVFSDLSEMMEG